MYRLPITLQQMDTFIIGFKKTHDGNSPTMRQIANSFGCSISTVHRYLYRMVARGFIALNGDGKSRMIEVIGAQWTPPQLRTMNPQVAFE
jgi:hypothetical protein